MICIDSLRGMEIKWGKYPRWTDSRVPKDVGQQNLDPVLEVHMHSYVFHSKLYSFWARVRN